MDNKDDNILECMEETKRSKKSKHTNLLLLVIVIAFLSLWVSDHYVRTQLVSKQRREVWSSGRGVRRLREHSAHKREIKIQRKTSVLQHHQFVSPAQQLLYAQLNATRKPLLHPPKETANKAPVRRGLVKSIPGVKLRISRKRVVMDNGFVQVTLSAPEGFITGIRYNGVDNLLEVRNKKSNRGYWDIAWDAPGIHSSTYRLSGRSFKVIMKHENQTELSFSSTWNPAMWKSSLDDQRVPLNLDLRYVMLRGSAGFYTYAILEREKGWPAMNIYQIRVVFRPRGDKFHYMAISDDRQRIMPVPRDRRIGKSLAFKEAVTLRDPTNPHLRGEVDDKYQYSSDGKENKVHGWISFAPRVGFWIITASNEYRTGGPMKQDLTSHVGPTTLAMFHSTHYAGKDVAMKFRSGKPWKKVFGPIFIHLNSASSHEDPRTLWDKAKQQMLEESSSWPYDFPLSSDFPKSHMRGSVAGRLLVYDRYISKSMKPASFAWVGLAPPAKYGSWQTISKGYQFWVQADDKGCFTIKGIHVGNYSLYAWVPGFIGDFKHDHEFTVTPGCKITTGDLVFQPPRNGATLWEIGVPDRTAAEFYVPDPKPHLSNWLLRNDTNNRFRQYGLWERYRDLYPDRDLTYTIGSSNYRKDWFFAHVPRRTRNQTYQATTWRIKFSLDDPKTQANYTLQLAIASATFSELHVWFNHQDANSQPHFTTKLIGRDNAIARHGIHGIYRLFSVNVLGSWLRKGYNTVYLKQTRCRGPFHGVMYDYIRFERPPPSPPGVDSALNYASI